MPPMSVRWRTPGNWPAPSRWNITASATPSVNRILMSFSIMACSLATKGNERIDTSGLTSGKEAGNEADQDDDCCDGRKREWIRRRDAGKTARKHARERVGARETEHAPHHDQ